MRISLLFFILGITFITIGYAYQVSPSKDESREIEFVPRNVYDQISRINHFIIIYKCDSIYIYRLFYLFL